MEFEAEEPREVGASREKFNPEVQGDRPEEDTQAGLRRELLEEQIGAVARAEDAAPRGLAGPRFGAPDKVGDVLPLPVEGVLRVGVARGVDLQAGVRDCGEGGATEG